MVRDSSVVRRLFVSLSGAVGRQSALDKENSGFADPTLVRHVSWLSDFIFYPKPLYKSLHQSVFYSFIAILPTGVRGTDHTPFSNFLFTSLFSIKFLYFFIISSLFPYFNLFVSIFIQSYVNIKLHVSTLYRYY